MSRQVFFCGIRFYIPIDSGGFELDGETIEGVGEEYHEVRAHAVVFASGCESFCSAGIVEELDVVHAKFFLLVSEALKCRSFI